MPEKTVIEKAFSGDKEAMEILKGQIDLVAHYLDIFSEVVEYINTIKGTEDAMVIRENLLTTLARARQ
ncbi:MAG: hypothetical protein ACUZ8E_17805 [Candidatus Anammoxibacter sp.]